MSLEQKSHIISLKTQKTQISFSKVPKKRTSSPEISWHLEILCIALKEIRPSVNKCSLEQLFQGLLVWKSSNHQWVFIILPYSEICFWHHKGVLWSVSSGLPTYHKEKNNMENMKGLKPYLGTGCREI